jgi:hypothetical protein
MGSPQAKAKSRIRNVLYATMVIAKTQMQSSFATAATSLSIKNATVFRLFQKGSGSAADANWWGAVFLLLTTLYVSISFRHCIPMLTFAGLHILSKYRWSVQANHRHEMGPSPMRHVDPRGVTRQHNLSGACAGCRKGSKNPLETGESPLWLN